MEEPQAPVIRTPTEPSTKRIEEEELSEVEIKVVDDQEDTVFLQKPEILKVHSCHVFQLRPGEKPSLTESHVFSPSTSEEFNAPRPSLPTELHIKIEKISDEENNDELARIKTQARENVKNNMSINSVEIKSELTRLTDKLFKYALDQKDVDGYNSIRCLVRRLRRSRCENPLDKLIQALRTRSADSDCITIPKSQDGRIQVAKKKCYPHVLYVKLFRYDDVTHSTPLLSLCKFGRGSSEKICVNPYHYEKAQTESVPNSKLTNNRIRTLTQIKIAKIEPEEIVSSSQSSSINSRIRIRRIDDSVLAELRKTPLEGHVWHRPEIWADVSLYEGESRVGTEVAASQPKISVLPPRSPYRRGLHRNPLKSYEFFRLNQRILDELNDGLEFYWSDSGILSVKNLTNLRLRIDSMSTKMQRQLDLYDPSLLEPKKEKEIFNFEIFQTLILKARQIGRKRMFSLREQCHVRVFFETESTNRVLNMPHLSESLWIMVILHWPLSLLDVYLQVQQF